MKKEEFGYEYKKLCDAFDKEIKEGQMLVYYEYLAGRKKEALHYAVNELILGSKFFPKIAEIIEIMKEYKEKIPVERQLQGAEEEESVPMPDDVRAMIQSMLTHIGGNKDEKPAVPNA